MKIVFILYEETCMTCARTCARRSRFAEDLYFHISLRRVIQVFQNVKHIFRIRENCSLALATDDSHTTFQ